MQFRNGWIGFNDSRTISEAAELKLHVATLEKHDQPQKVPSPMIAVGYQISDINNLFPKNPHNWWKIKQTHHRKNVAKCQNYQELIIENINQKINQSTYSKKYKLWHLEQ